MAIFRAALCAVPTKSLDEPRALKEVGKGTFERPREGETRRSVACADCEGACNPAQSNAEELSVLCLLTNIQTAHDIGLALMEGTSSCLC